ncbi:MAG: phosphate acetyltransferase [Opitutales bacterium]|nr:phosphate acetyltransferase [Opitutales bacterium]
MSLINKLSARLQNHPKRIVFPEGEDPRIIKAARMFSARKLGVPILIGSRPKIEETAKNLDVSLENIRILEIDKSDDFEDLLKILKGMPKFRNLELADVERFLRNPNYFATLMLATSRADAMVSGATQLSASSLRPVFQLISLQKGFKTASSMTIVETGNPNLGADGVLFLSDCGVIPEPTEDQLAEIAITTAKLANHLTGAASKVAMLSFVSKLQVAKTSSVLKVKAATALAHQRAQSETCEIEVDGELQVDSALVPAAAKARGINSSVAGKANVLIFPDLNSGNISSKILNIVGCRTYGQILTGLVKPVAEVTRSSHTEDIFGAAVVVAAQAVDMKYLYP